MPNNDNTGEAAVTAVAIKLPEFWINSPEVWFARVEAQFNIRGIISDTTKYDYTVGALDYKTAEEVQSILVNPPNDDKYRTLKAALIKAFGKSQAQKDLELLNLGGLGDRRPTALLRRINALNDDPATLKRALFLLNLPAEIRSILASQQYADIDGLAEAADRVWETRTTSACSVNSTEPIAPEPQINAFHKQSTGPAQHRSNRNSKPPAQNICFYHNKFGSKARRCEPGCKFANLIQPATGNGPAGRI